MNKAIVDDYFQSTSLTAFDQIAKESRKYGLFLYIYTNAKGYSSRHFISDGYFLVHRLINYNDKEAIRQSCSSANSDILAYLPVLGEGEAILTGADFYAIKYKSYTTHTTPDSSTPLFKKGN